MLLLPIVLMILVTRLDYRPIGDEVFHKQVVDSFSAAWPLPEIGDYPATSTPLAYIIMSTIGRIAGTELWKMRLVAAIATFLAASLFYDLARRRNLPHPLLSAFLFVFFPYIFFHGFTIYTDGFAMVFALWALKYYLSDEQTRSSQFKASLLATLAVLTRQIYVVLPAGILLYEVWRVLRSRSFAGVRSRILSWVILAIPFVVLLPVFWIWGGFTTPAHQAERGGDFFLILIPQHLSFFFIFSGFYFLPILGGRSFIATLRSNKYVLLFPVILIPLFLMFPPLYSEERDLVGAATGIIAHGLDLGAQVFGRQIFQIVKLALWGVGIVILAYGILNSALATATAKIYAILFAFLALVMFTPYVAERYYAVAIPWLILILHNRFRSQIILMGWVTIQIILSAGFSYWQIVLK